MSNPPLPPPSPPSPNADRHSPQHLTLPISSSSSMHRSSSSPAFPTTHQLPVSPSVPSIPLPSSPASSSNSGGGGFSILSLVQTAYNKRNEIRKGAFELGGKAVGGIFRKVTGSDRNPAMENLAERTESIISDLNRQQISIVEFSRFLVQYARQTFNESREENKTALIQFFQTQVNETVGKAVGNMFDNDADLLEQTIVANILNLFTNLANTAYNTRETRTGFRDGQRNFLGKFITLFSLDDCRMEFEEIEEETTSQGRRKQLFHQIAGKLLLKGFPNGAQDVILFHDGIPVETVKAVVCPILHVKLAELIENLYADTESSDPTWQGRFNAAMAIPEAHHLVTAPSALIKAFIIDDAGRGLTESLTPKLDKWLREEHIDPVERARNRLITTICELLLTQSQKLKKIGSFFETMLMERVLARLSDVPEGVGPLLPYKIHQLLPLLEEIIQVFRTQDGTNSDLQNHPNRGLYESVLHRLLYCLGWDQRLPLPERALIQLDLEPKIRNLISKKVLGSLVELNWPAMRNEHQNLEYLHRNIPDQRVFSPFIDLVPNLCEIIFNALKDQSTLQSILGSLPTELTADQLEAITAQWTALFADEAFATTIKERTAEVLRPVIIQMLTDVHRRYTEETTPPEIAEGGEPPARQPFDQWLIQKVTAALNEVAIERFSPSKMARLRRYVELQRLLKGELAPEERQGLTQELKDLTPRVRGHFERAAQTLLRSFGYERAEQLPIPFAQDKLWKALPDLLLKHGSRLLIPTFSLNNNLAEIQQIPNPAIFNAASAFVPKLAELIVHKATEVSTLEHALRALPFHLPQEDVHGLRYYWNQFLVNPEDPSQPRPQIPAHLKRLIETLVQPIVVQCFADMNRTYLAETEPQPAAEGAVQQERKAFDTWFVEKMAAALNEVDVTSFTSEQRAALIRTNELQRLLKNDELSDELRQQYKAELANTSRFVKPKFQQASQALFRAFGFTRAADIPLPYGQEVLWEAIPELLMEHGGPLLSHQFALLSNRAAISQQVGDASPVNGLNVISTALSGLLAHLLTGPGLMRKLSGWLSTAANEGQIDGFGTIWRTFLSNPEATIHTNLEHGVDVLLNPALTQLFADLRATYRRETEGQEPPMDFTVWVVGKLTAVFNEVTFDRFPEDQRARLRRALAVKELVAVEQDPVRKQQLAQELEQHWVVLKPHFDRAAARFFAAFGYERAEQLPIPYGQQPLWNYFSDLIFDHMSDPLVPFLEREECRAALRAHNFGEQLHGQPLGEMIISGCQQLSSDILNHLPEYINSYETLLTQLNNDAAIPYRLTQDGILALAAAVTQLVADRRLNGDTLFNAFEAAFLAQHPNYTPQQREAVQAAMKRSVKVLKKVLVTPEQIAEKLSSLNATPAVKRHLAQQIRTLVNREDGPSQPVKEFIGSYIEGMALLGARQAVTLFNRETLDAVMALLQQTKTQLDQHPDQVEALIDAFVEQIIARFGIASALDIRGIPFSLNKKVLNGIKSALKTKLHTAYQLERQCREILEVVPQTFLPPAALGAPPADGGDAPVRRAANDFETAIYTVIRNSLQSATDYLTTQVPPRGGDPAAAAPQLQGINDLYRSIRTTLTQMAREHYGVAATITTLLDNNTFTPYLTSFLNTLNQPEFAGYQATAAALVTPFVTERATRVLETFTVREAAEGSDYHQGILREMLQEFHTHLRTMNQASAIEGGLNVQNYRQAYEAGNRQLHPAVPREQTTDINRAAHFEQRQSGFFLPTLEDLFHLVFPGGIEEVKALVRNYAPELVAPIWESSRASIGETLSQQLERLFNNDLFLTLMNTVLENIITALRAPIVFAAPAVQAPVQRAQQDVHAHLVGGEQPAALRGQNNAPADVIPRAQNNVPVQVGVGAQPVGPGEQNNNPVQPIPDAQPEGPRGQELNNQVDAIIGECITEGVRYFDLPIIKSILSLSPRTKHFFRIDRLENNTYRSIGNAIRAQLQNRPIQESVNRAVARLSQQHNARVAAAVHPIIPPPENIPEVENQPNQARPNPARAAAPEIARPIPNRPQPPAQAPRRAQPAQNPRQPNVPTAPLNPRERLRELKSELAKELVSYPFRYLAAYIRHLTTTRFRAVNAVTHAVLAVLSFVMTRVIGGAVKILKIDKLAQVCIENLIDNIENRLSLPLTNFQLNENLIYNEVEVFRRLIRG